MTDFPVVMQAVQRKDPEELAALCLELWGRVAYLESVPQKTQRKVAKATGSQHDTWLTPAQHAWESVMGAGSFQWGPAAKYLAPLRRGYSDAEIGRRLAMYLRDLKRTDSTRYASYRRFAETVAMFNPDELAFPEDL